MPGCWLCASVDTWPYSGAVLAAEAPKITDWMQAWGSVVGLLLSGVAALATWLLFRHEIRVRRDEQRDEEAAQARLVVGSIVAFGPSVDIIHEGGVVQGSVRSASWKVKNYSSAPIFQVGVWLNVRTHDGWGEDQIWDVVDDEIQGTIGIEPALESGSDGYYGLDDFTVEVVFTDAGGATWLRDGRVSPYRTTGPLSKTALTPLPWWPKRWLKARNERRRLRELKPPF
jgi:hypothetical protein